MRSAPLSADTVVGDLSGHPHVAALAARVRAAALAAAEAGTTTFAETEAPAAANGVTAEQAQTRYGNALDVLQNGPSGPEERLLLGSLLALAVREQPPASDEEWKQLAARLVWLATHTDCDALAAADAALPDPERLWTAVAALIAAPPESQPTIGISERVVAALALKTSPSPAAATLAAELASEVTAPALVRALGAVRSETREPMTIEGEVGPYPFGRVATVLLAITGLLLLRSLVRLALRYAFSLKRRARVTLSGRGLEIDSSTVLLGRMLREDATVIPLDNLVAVTREVRFARAGFYAGLVALVVGTYLGVGLIVDGLRAPGMSPSLLGLGLLFVGAGLGLDFALATFVDSDRERVRLVVRRKKGRPLSIAALDRAETDQLLRRVFDELPSSSAAP